MGFDLWPDIPGLPDFPDLPSPGEVLELMLRSLSGGMRADAQAAVEAILEGIANSSGPDFMNDWVRLMFSLVFGLAMGATIFLSLPIIVISSLSREMNAIERMIHTFQHAIKLLLWGYIMLPIFALGFAVAGVLTKGANTINDIGGQDPSNTLGGLFGDATLPSVFGDLSLNLMIMVAGGFLNADLQLIQYSLVPLAILTPLAYSVKQINIWGYRLWKLYVSFVAAVMFTTPVVVLIISVAAQVAGYTTSWSSTVQGFYLLSTLLLGALTPFIIIALAYVGYTVQVGKSQSRVEGKVETMPLQQQYRLYGRHIANMVNQKLAEPRATMQAYAPRPHKDRVMRDYIRSYVASGVDMKINTAKVAAAAKVAGVATGGVGTAASVLIGAVGTAASRKAHQTIEGGGRR